MYVDYLIINKDYLKFLSQFSLQYYKNINSKDVYNLIKNDDKIEFRYFCFRYLDYVKKYKLPQIIENSKYESVLIESRNFPHVEFTIRNTIYKLGEGWSHSVLCTNNNYQLIKEICDNISPLIKIIKLPYGNLDIDNYNKLLYSKFFWNLFVGEKILIYQEDSCIFNNNISDFLDYDYIGAPWLTNYETNTYHVGNGGLSLRSKSIMLQIIDKFKGYSPEDLFFTKNMLDHNIGKLADYETAKRFSIENIYYDGKDGPFAGHNFWLCKRPWKHFMYKYVIV
jgi:hypothetical protein